MSKNFIIPLGKILRLNPIPINQNIIKKVNFNEINLISQKNNLIAEFTINTFDVETQDVENDDGTITTELKSVSINNDFDKIFVDNSITDIEYSDRTEGGSIASTRYRDFHFTFSFYPNIKIDTNSIVIKVESVSLKADNFSEPNLNSTHYYDEIVVENLQPINYTTGNKYGYDLENSIITDTYLQYRFTINYWKTGHLIYDYLIKKSTIKIYANNYEENSIENAVGEENSKNTFSLTTNEFMNEKTKYQNEKINSYNANYILDEYVNGKETIELQIVESDYFDYSNKLVINKEKGEIANVGDIFRYYQKDGTLSKEYKITNREFNYNGITKINIKAKEV